MGRRINLAALAEDDFYEAPPQPGPALQAAEVQTEPPAPNQRVPVSSVSLNPLNKRPPGGDSELSQMADTIRELGVIQPLVVCSTEAYLAEFPAQSEVVGDARWVVLIGNRRLRAARLAELDEVEIVVNDGQVTSMYEVMLVENGQRRELPPLLEAEAMAEVLRGAAISQRELARRIGKSHMYIKQRLALLRLIPQLRALFEHGELTIERAREFGELPVDEQEAIYAAGKPYRHPSAAGAGRRPTLRSIRVSSPAVAAESIRLKFSADELAELVELLSAHLKTSTVTGD
jgi:ParB family chromosome partitioning protein